MIRRYLEGMYIYIYIYTRLEPTRFKVSTFELGINLHSWSTPKNVVNIWPPCVSSLNIRISRRVGSGWRRVLHRWIAGATVKSSFTLRSQSNVKTWISTIMYAERYKSTSGTGLKAAPRYFWCSIAYLDKA